MSMFSDLVEEVMEIFVDDFTVYGSSFEQCLKNLETVLQRCQDKQLADSCHGRVSGINKICIHSSSYCRSQATAA